MRICLSGATGSVGRCLAAAILETDDLCLASAVARAAAGVDLGIPLGIAPTGVIVTDQIDLALDAEPDVLIDYTHPSVIYHHTMAAVSRGIPVVIGTSGLSSIQLAEIDEIARRTGVGAIVGNFSLTAAIMQHVSLITANHIRQWEIIEYNKSSKPDVPSGTATELAELLAAVSRPQVDIQLSGVIGQREARGASVGGSQVHSVRLPGFGSACEVIFGAFGQRLTIRHESLGNDSIFVDGTLLAARHVTSMLGVVRGLDQLLFGE